MRRLESLQIPSAEAVQTAAERLQAAVERARAMASTDAGRAGQIADLLARSLELHAAHGDQPCPVCGDGMLGGAWRARTEAEVKRLRQDADDAVQAQRSLKEARLGAHALFAPPPPELQRAQEVDVDAAGLTSAWTRWRALPDDLTDAQLIDHLRQSCGAGSAAQLPPRSRSGVHGGRPPGAASEAARHMPRSRRR